MPVSQIETYVWNVNTSYGEENVIGQESTIIGETTDSANELLKLLFNNQPFKTVIRQADKATAIIKRKPS